MNIGIDIDGVLTNMERIVTDFATKMCVEENWNISVNASEYDQDKAFNWTKEQTDKFWNKYLVKYVTETPAREFAKEILEKLQQEGNQIYLITARNEEGLPPEYYGKMQELTKQWLKSQNIKYDKLIFAQDTEKLQQCLENNVTVMIEDSPTNIKNISKKIKTIKFDCKYNQNVNNENITTAYSWYHIYKIIKEMKGE